MSSIAPVKIMTEGEEMVPYVHFIATENLLYDETTGTRDRENMPVTGGKMLVHVIRRGFPYETNNNLFCPRPTSFNLRVIF